MAVWLGMSARGARGCAAACRAFSVVFRDGGRVRHFPLENVKKVHQCSSRDDALEQMYLRAQGVGDAQDELAWMTFAAPRARPSIARELRWAALDEGSVRSRLRGELLHLGRAQPWMIVARARP